MTSRFTVEEGEVLFDIGCAEGNIALAHVEKAGRVVLFECDEEWIEALNATFAPWKEKVTIIPKLVSSHTHEATVSIGDFLKTFPQKPHFVKMD